MVAARTRLSAQRARVEIDIEARKTHDELARLKAENRYLLESLRFTTAVEGALNSRRSVIVGNRGGVGPAELAAPRTDGHGDD
jgi:hypothetical protein